MIFEIITVLALVGWCALAYRALKPYFYQTDDRLKDWERRQRDKVKN